MNYGIIFYCKKKVVRIITGSKNKSSCHALFRSLNILTLQTQYIFSLLCSIIMNRDKYMLNSDIHITKMRQRSNFYQAISILALYPRGTYHMDLKIYKRQPAYTNDISHSNKEL